ncbi:MAG: CBS domain-containing protein [Legionella sp.]|nr:CBS domain-containing protein [Legionella sp.]
MTQLIYSVLPRKRRPIIFINPELSVAECVELMFAEDIGALVVHDDLKLLGMVTERDIVRSCLKRDLDQKKITAGEIAYRNVSVLNIDDPVERAMETITLTKRRHVLVSENGELVAILSIGDLLFYLLDDKSRVIEHLENYITS